MLINPIPFIHTMSGKVISGVSNWWATTRYGKTYSAHKNKGRDYKTHPVTEEERKTRERFKLAAKEYTQWQPSDEEAAAFEAAFREQQKSKKPCKTRQGFYRRVRMAEMKQEGLLMAIAENNLQDWNNRSAKWRQVFQQAQRAKKASTSSSASDSCRA